MKFVAICGCLLIAYCIGLALTSERNSSTPHYVPGNTNTTGWMNTTSSSQVPLGHGYVVKRSAIEDLAREQGVSYSEAEERFRNLAAVKRAIENVKRTPERYGVDPKYVGK